MLRRVLPLAVLVGALVVVPLPADAAGDGTVFSFTDDRIDESSGLVDLGPLMVTTNDSGDSARVFTVDPATGDTVGVTEFGADVVDVEALAPAGGDRVWVGDIGDNGRARPEVAVYRVPVGRGELRADDPVAYRFTYPDGPHDAESLFTDASGRLWVISKAPLGGAVYRAPADLDPDGTNELEPVARVVDYATDAAMTRDHRRVVVRGYGQASVYSFPDFARLGTFTLPRQQQGEGLSVGPRGRVRLSSEGVGAPVLQVSVPSRLLAPGATPATSGASGQQPGEDGEEPEAAWLLWSVPAVAVLAAALLATGLRRRRRRAR